MFSAASKTDNVSSAANYIEDVFSTYLYTGNSTSGGTQTITNNIDLSTKGGMVWIKGRSAASNHILSDTARGAGASATNNNALASNLTSAEDLGGSSYDFLSAFNADGFTVKQGGTTTATRGANYNNVTYASWTFRKQPKFFDVVTYTGNGASTQTINHSLGAVPGCIIIKKTSAVSSLGWTVWHRSLTSGHYLLLNSTAASTDDSVMTGSNAPTATTFTAQLAVTDGLNASGQNYVAYLFAHDAGGFGVAGTDNVISCGSFTSSGTGTATVTLGYEPQFIIYKQSNGTENWWMMDTMRGWNMSGSDAYLNPNQSLAESTAARGNPTATGFTIEDASASSDYIYIAIRRGPMKTPTSGTQIYSGITRSGTGSATTITGTNFPVDVAIVRSLAASAGYQAFLGDRMRGGNRNLSTSSGTGEALNTGLWWTAFDNMSGASIGTSSDANSSGVNYINWFFMRAPSFMDVVCYTGTGSNTTQTHNLGVVPELMIVKRRDTTGAWDTYSAALANTEYLVLNTTAAKATGATRWNSTTPTSSVFSLGTSTTVNASGGTYVAYLFASCPGVSKVGSYTGSGTTKQIDCGFTGGARLVIIKRTDSTGDWYIWDSARGIVAGNDPYLLLNSTDAEVTNTDYVDTYSAGFEISSTAPAAINASGGTFVFFAIS